MNRSKRFHGTDPVPSKRGRLLAQLQLVPPAVGGFLLLDVLAHRLLVFAHRRHIGTSCPEVLPGPCGWRPYPSELQPLAPPHTSEESTSARAHGLAADGPLLCDTPSAEPARGIPPPIPRAIAHTEPSAETSESTSGTPIRNAVTLKRCSSEPSFSLNFERFTEGRLFAIPVNVKHRKSPGQSRGLT